MVLLDSKNREVKIGAMLGPDRLAGFSHQNPGMDGSGIIALIKPSGENFDVQANVYGLRVVDSKPTRRKK